MEKKKRWEDLTSEERKKLSYDERETLITMYYLRRTLKYSVIGIITLIILIMIFKTFVTIRANEVGIMYNPFNGGIQNGVLSEGFKFKNPMTKVYKISTQVQEFTYSDISVQTSDSQYVTAIMQVQVRIDREQAFEYFKKYGGKDLKNIQNILSSTVQKQLEKITTQYNVMELLGDKRNEIVDKTYELIATELLNDGIEVQRIILVDTDAGDAIEQAIANEAVAKKQAETAEYLKQKAQLEGEAKVIEAQKQNEANQLLEKSLTNSILTEKMLEKWNGVLPTTMLKEDIMSMFSVGGK